MLVSETQLRLSQDFSKPSKTGKKNTSVLYLSELAEAGPPNYWSEEHLFETVLTFGVEATAWLGHPEE